MSRLWKGSWSRRRFLRGAGGVSIALPLCVAKPNFAAAAPGQAPSRYVGLFYGNGLPADVANRGFSGVGLRPLADIYNKNKLSVIRGFSVNESSSSDIHNTASKRFNVGRKGVSGGSGGQSLDDALFRKFGTDTKLLNLVMAVDNISTNPETRHWNSWRASASNNTHIKRPLEAFAEVFGGGTTPPPPSDDSNAEEVAAHNRAARYHNSVLDAVTESYREVMSERSGYSVSQRSAIANHLDLVRELERRALAMEGMTGEGPAIMDCTVPKMPADITPAQDCTPELCPTEGGEYLGGGGTNWNQVWPLLADIHVAAMRCGVVRFGTLTCTGGGDRYPIPELNLPGGSTPHQLGHEWTSNKNNRFDECVEWVMAKIAYYLKAMDDPNWTDPAGGTLLDNTLVLIGSEMSHQHSANDWTFMIAGGGGRIKSGTHQASGRSDVDIYSTISRAMSLGERFGTDSEFSDHIDIVV